jgi:phosphatidylglycerophosphate synthase
MAKKAGNNFTEYNAKMFKEFRKSLKHVIFDDTLTLYILRPIAFIFVKVLCRTKITPNQVSLIGILVGITSGFFFTQGTATSFMIAGGILFLALILDCVDGMLARLKKNGTAIGRVIDGFSDYVVQVAVYLGMAIGFGKGFINLDFFPISHWWVFAICAASQIFHAMITDYYRVEFMAHGLGKATSTWEEKKKFTDELNRIKHQKGKILEKILITVYLGYSHLQLFKMDEKEEYDRKTYLKANKTLIHLWFWIGPIAHVFVLVISALLFRPLIFFIFTIGFANVYLFILWIIQVRVNKKILITKKGKKD